MQAAQTGHLVLSTLHTDDAPSVVTRLMDIGAEPYVIASALIGVIAQRLVRRLCVHCRRQYTPPPDVLRALNIAEADAAAIPFYKAVGCDQCNHTGYRGRIGIYEVMRVTDKLRRLIAAKAPEDQLREAALAGGMITPRRGRPGQGEERHHHARGAAARRHRSRARCGRSAPGCGSAVGVDFLRVPAVRQARWAAGVRTAAGRCSRAGTSARTARAAPSAEAVAKRLRERDDRDGRRELPPANIAEFKK